MNCQACRNSVSKADCLTCKKCTHYFHYQCLNLASAKSPWHCPTCVGRARKSGDTDPRKDNTPIHSNIASYSLDTSSMSGDESLYDDQNIPSSVNTAPRGQMSKSSITYEDFIKLLDQRLHTMEDSITRKINATIHKEINTAIDKLKADFTETTDFLAAEQADFKRNIQAADAKMSALELENSKLHGDFTSISKKLHSLDKASRSRNVEIQAVPERRSENLISMLKNLSDVLATSFQEADLCSVRRVAKLNPNSSRPRNILVTLPSERHRDSLISSFKRFNNANKADPVNTTHLGIEGEKNRIYVVEHLSPVTKELHAAARKFAKEASYKYIWVKYDRVYLRKSDNNPAIHVKDLSYLKNLQ